MRSEALISVRNLKKEYPGVIPLKDINADIYKGEVISIIGPSGTGKSTFIRCLNLLEKPTSGSITFEGMDILDSKTDVNRLRMRIGMVFQSFDLFSNKTIAENIMLGPMDLLKVPKNEAKKQAMELLKTVYLEDKADSYPDELSGGQKQRVAIVRALAMNPEVILFDEPTSALDPTMVDEVLGVIKDLKKKKLTMLIVTHEMNFAREISDRVFYLDDGEVYEEGSPEQIFGNPSKEKTRRFIEKIKTLETEFSAGSFNFYKLNGEITEYAHRYNVPHGKVMKIYSVFEELLTLSVIPLLRPDINVSYKVSYSDKTELTEVVISYAGDRLNPIETIDSVSGKILANVTDEIKYTFDSEKKLNQISIMM